MILITNEQDTIQVDVVQMERDAQTILNDLGYGDYDLGILIATPEVIHTYNKQYRGHDKPTDILSFPYHTELEAGDTIELETEEDKNVGDIIICPEYVMNDLERWGLPFKERMQVLLVHGICHLLGYDHEEDEEYEIMKQEEERLLQLIKNS